jgi:hypothetical protein
MAKTVAKQDSSDALVYDSLDYSTFPAVTLTSNQVTGTIAATIPCALATKIFGITAVLTTYNGSAPINLNICSGFAGEGGVGPIDPGPAQGYPPTAAQMAQPGNILFSSDVGINGTSAPVVNTVYTIYAVNGLWDIIWPPNSAITLRVSTGAAANASVLVVSLLYKVIDIHPYQPNGAIPFAPLATIL